MRHADLLAQIPMFQGLSDADREALAERMTGARVPVGRDRLRQGRGRATRCTSCSPEACRSSCRPARRTRARVALKDVRTGEYFGELSLFDDKPRSASVDRDVDTVLLELDARRVRRAPRQVEDRGDADPERDGRAPARDQRDARPARRHQRRQGDRREPHVGPAPRRQGRRAQRKLGVHHLPPRADLGVGDRRTASVPRSEDESASTRTRTSSSTSSSRSSSRCRGRSSS